MSSELLASGVDNLKGHLAGAFNVLTGSSGDYTDLGIGRKFGGAAAAYSLRDVGAMNGPVVRVRRDSDNSEQDFSALAVPFIPEWCNRQVIKPLDVKALQSDGRTGDFIIAKAAYSLRSLGDRQATVAATNDTVARADGKYVVQVRRNVDGTIKSFTADEVSDGTLASFVNESFTSSLPLDVQGSAAAAYSLRDLKTGGTSVTSSGDTAGDTTSNYVVQVRRSSDDTIKSFTADSITNGDLLTFVNEDVTIYQSDFSAGVNGFTQTSTTTLTGNQDGVSDEAGTTKDNVLKAVKASDAQGYIQRDQGVVAGLTYTVSGTFFAPTSNTSVDGIMIKDGLSGSALSNFPSGYLTSGGLWTDFSFSYTATASGNQRINFGISSLASNPTSSSTGSTGDIFYISDLKFVETTSNGHVATWYDQSGNDNHATQGTADSQPKIVSSGSLNADGLLFDGVDDYLDSTSNISSPLWSFITHKATKDNSAVFATKSGDRWLGRRSTGTFLQVLNSVVAGGSYPSSTIIRTDEVNGSDSKIFSNGTSVATGDSGSAQSNFGRIGAQGQLSDTKFLGGNIQELIVYTSDVSGKRRAIEESIATNYSITLASFSRDGMVRTWYDQSVTDQGGATGNAHHAVQATAANQPKVVSNGSLVADQGIDFDDASEHSLVASSVSGMEEKLSVFSTSVRDSTGYTISLSSSSSGSKYFAILENASDSTLSSRNESTVQAAPSVSGNTRLTFGLTTGDTVTSAGALGGALTTNTADYGDDFGSGDLDQILIGALRTVSPSAGHYFEGRIREILVYASSATGDQTDNRGAFEANIASHYGITAIPTAADPPTVNGFVETWYDQSGNGKDAIQTTATYQPKIVHEGSFNTDGGLLFDGDDTSLDSGSSTSLSTEFFVTGVMNLNTYVDENAAIITNAEAGGGDRLFIGTSDILRIRDDSTNISSSLVLSKTADNLFTYQASASSFTFVKNGTTDAKSALSGGQSYRYIGGGSGFNLSANMKELIIYSSDKTSDRTAIESNINNHYSIF